MEDAEHVHTSRGLHHAAMVVDSVVVSEVDSMVDSMVDSVVWSSRTDIGATFTVRTMLALRGPLD